MRLSLGIGLSNRSSTSTGPTITSPGSIDVSSFAINVTQTVTLGIATATGGGSIAYEIEHAADGEVKSTSAGYAYLVGDLGEAGVVRWRAVESGGTNDGATSWQILASGTINDPSAADGLLIEAGDALLMETNDRILLEA